MELHGTQRLHESKHPKGRFALLASLQDDVLRQYFGYETALYEAKTKALLAAKYDGRANAKYFALPGAGHTLLGSQFTVPGLNDFITRWYTGDSGWANDKPR